MPKYRENSGKEWTKADDRKLEDLADGNTPTRIIAIKLRRTPAAISTHASKIGVSLRPPNQRPYGTKKR